MVFNDIGGEYEKHFKDYESQSNGLTKYAIGKSNEKDFVDNKMHDEEKKVLLLDDDDVKTTRTSSTLMITKGNG